MPFLMARCADIEESDKNYEWYLQKLKDDVMLNWDEVNVFHEEHVAINEVSGYRYAFEGINKASSIPARIEEFCTVYDGLTFSITISTDPGDGEKHASEIALVFDSIRLTDGGANPFATE